MIHLIVPMAREPLWLTAKYVTTKLELLVMIPELRLLFVSDKEHTKNQVSASHQIVRLPEDQRARATFLRCHHARSVKGGALHTGFDAALSEAQEGDLMGFTDLDTAVSNVAIARFLREARSSGGALMVATRIGRSAGERAASAAFQAAVKLAFPVLRHAVQDLQAGLKLCTPSFLASYYECHRRDRRDRDVSFNLDWDLVGYAVARGLRVVEIPVAWQPNDDYSSRSAANVVRTMYTLLWKCVGRGGGVLSRRGGA